MITAGIDLGASYAKMIILENGKVIGRGITEVTLEQQEAVQKVQELALKDAGIDRKAINAIGATGSGRHLIKDAQLYITDVTADAAGAYEIDKSIRTVIDVGGEEARAIKVSEDGKIVNSAVNDKCAAGAGAFCEAMARAMQLS
ncbi:MAG: BadF/BadG/BcrA/BcrD ATPase family protein, partial [Thermodesulfobacteriota bacterium]|nr:BadF/BadG/BcrA/BcrD ATPase family protein [Thermodesulfobacteriota bacterium]